MPALPAAQALTLICRADSTFHWTRNLTPWAPQLALTGTTLHMWMIWDDGTRVDWSSGAAPTITNADVEFDGASNVACFLKAQSVMQSHAGNARWSCQVVLANGAINTIMGGTAIWSASDLIETIPAPTGVDGIPDTVFVLGEATQPLVPMPPDAAAAISATRASADLAYALQVETAGLLATFKNVYYGALLSEPLTRPDGTASQKGDAYYDESVDALFVSNGTKWTLGYTAGTGLLAALNNLSDVGNIATARANLGLGAVDNTSDASKPVSTAQAAADAATLASANTFATNADTVVATNASTALAAHTSNTSNPHAVTAAQVGLGNVNNTSDANKPVSTAQALADAAVLSAAETFSSNAGNLNSGTIPAARLPATAVSAGSYGDGSHVTTLTVGADGRLTAAGATPIAIAAGAVSGLAPVATSGSASDLATGTLPNARLSAVPNSALANSSVTISGHVINLGGSLSIAASDVAGLGALATLTPGSGVATALALATNAAYGVPVLDSTGKVSTAQLPASVLGDLQYQGGWNASTNSPAIPTAAAGNKGWYYVVTTAGSTNVSGVTSWNVGDWLVSNGASWDKIDNTDLVTSVAGRTGAVTLSYTDIAGIYALASVIPGTGVAAAAANPTNASGGFLTYSGAFGTPTSINLANATGLPAAALTGTLQAAQEPAHTGDVTNTAGSLAMTVAAIGGKAVAFGGAFTMSGAYAFTGTLTGATNVTFPTGGTLATTANISTALPSATTSQIYGGTGAAGVSAAVSIGSGLSLSGGVLSSSAGTVTSVAASFTGGIVSVAGSPITSSGTLALTVAGTSGGVPYFSGGTTWASSAALAANALVVGGGAGQPPATVTTGAGVVSALGSPINTSGGLAGYSAITSALPYVFDGIESDAVISAPKLAYRLKGPALSSDIVTISSAAKYLIGPSGGYVSNAANGPAYSYASGRRRLVIEPIAATNYWLNSESHSSDGLSGYTLGASTANAFGGVSLTAFTATTSSGYVYSPTIAVNGSGQQITATVVIVPGVSTTAKLWVTGGTATTANSSVTFIFGPGAAAFSSGSNGPIYNLTGLQPGVPTVVRITYFSSYSGSSRLYVYSNDAIGGTFQLGGAQIEYGFGSSYIPCGGTATARAADVVTLSATALALLQYPGATLVMRGTISGGAAGAVIGATAGSNAQIAYDPTTGNATAYPDGLSPTLVAASSASADFGLCVSWSPIAGRKLAVNGGAMVSDTSGLFTSTDTTVKLGTGAAGAVNMSIDELVIVAMPASSAAVAAQAHTYS